MMNETSKTTTWHKDIKSLKNISQCLFKNETMSDCSFLVKEGKRRTKIPAHKFILGGYSPEFYNLFYLMKASSDVIPINDISVESLSSFLEFLYKETTELNMENVGDLFKLADRYSVESFKNFCNAFLLQNITVDNVLTVMDEYSIYELPTFETGCLKIIRRKLLCFQDPSFYKISNRTLTTILKSEELNRFTEFEIFEGTNKWAEKYCAKMGQPVISKYKRQAVGSALQYIRFGAMSVPEFASCSILENSILTPMEINSIFQFIGTSGRTVCQYSGEKRSNKIIKLLFHKYPKASSPNSYEFKGYDLLTFSVNQPIFIHGFEIYGREKSLCNVQNPEKFIIQLKNELDAVLMENIVEIKYNESKVTYEMFFKDKKLINVYEEYKIYLKRLTPGRFINYEVMRPVDSLNIGKVHFNIRNREHICAGIIFSD